MAENGNEPKSISEIMSASWDEAMGQDVDDLPDDSLGTEDTETSSQESQEGEGTPSQEPAQTPEDGQQQADTPPEEPVDLPAHWPEQDRQMFARLEKDAQQWLLNRHRQMEADYTRKTQENAEAVRIGSVVSRNLDPAIQQELRGAGITGEQFVSHLIDWHKYSTRDPAGFLKQVATNLGVDPAKVFALENQGGEAPKPDPLQQRLASVEQYLTREQQARQQAIAESARTTLQQFAEEKDEAGNVVHAHFDRVKPTMGRLMLADPSLDLKQAYEIAVFRDPEIRDSVLPKPPGPQVDTRKIAEGARAARAAGANIRGRGVTSETSGSPGKMRLRDAIRAAADEVGIN